MVTGSFSATIRQKCTGLWTRFRLGLARLVGRQSTPGRRRRLSGGPALRDLLDEALAGVAARPTRLVLTTLGTVLGIAALVATVGLGQTASGQITQRFDLAAATRVVVQPEEKGGQEGEAATQ